VKCHYSQRIIYVMNLMIHHHVRPPPRDHLIHRSLAAAPLLPRPPARNVMVGVM